MKVLSIDTSTGSSVVGLSDGARVLAHDSEGTDQKHAETLLPRIATLLAAAQWSLETVELIAVGTGPGSFTGLRVGLATAKGLALSTGIALCAVPTLPVLARAAISAPHPGAILSAIDAGRGEVFFAFYEAFSDASSHGALRQRGEGQLARPEALAAMLRELGDPQLVAVGSGARRYASLLETQLGRPLRLAPEAADTPQTEHLAAEAMHRFASDGPSNVAALEPLYMRASDAKLPDRPLALD